MTSARAATRFGTDGIRGRFGEPPLDRATVTALGHQLAAQLTAARGAGPPAVVLGGDTRRSTPTLCRWLTAGLRRGGVTVRYAGVIPTPGVAYLARRLGAACGIAVSASHNPAPDNGIKLIGGDGFKWPRRRERELEARLAAELAGSAADDQAAEADGGDQPLPEAEPGLVELYAEALAASLTGPSAAADAAPADAAPLAGLSVAVDAANGAGAALAAPLFRRLGAEVTALGDAPDGDNINHGCGSTAPEAMAEATRAGAGGRPHQLGIALDGDADRAVFADEAGTVRDGDAVLYLWARELAAAGELEPPAIVATSMSNLGLERALAADGIAVVRCDVGDRVVVETLRERGLRLGGEQSGHIVDLSLSTTGDGLLTALQVAAAVARFRRKRPDAALSDLLTGFRKYPQILYNVEVAAKTAFSELPAVVDRARQIEAQLGDEGRLVLRYSGTEPLARVMIEGPDQQAIETMARSLGETIRQALAG